MVEKEEEEEGVGWSDKTHLWELVGNFHTKSLSVTLGSQRKKLPEIEVEDLVPTAADSWPRRGGGQKDSRALICSLLIKIDYFVWWWWQ